MLHYQCDGEKKIDGVRKAAVILWYDSYTHTYTYVHYEGKWMNKLMLIKTMNNKYECLEFYYY